MPKLPFFSHQGESGGVGILYSSYTHRILFLNSKKNVKKVENKIKEYFERMQHFAPLVGRAYLLLASLQIHSDDLRDTMADYISWLKLGEAQKQHNAEPNKLDHLNEWTEKSKDIGNKKYKCLEKIVVYVYSALAQPSRAAYVLELLFEDEDWQRAIGGR